MNDGKLWRIWFAMAIIGVIILVVLPMFGIPID